MTEGQKALVWFVKDTFDNGNKSAVVVPLDGSKSISQLIDTLMAAKIQVHGVATPNSYNKDQAYKVSAQRDRYVKVIDIHEININEAMKETFKQTVVLGFNSLIGDEARIKEKHDRMFLDSYMSNSVLHYVANLVNGFTMSPRGDFNDYLEIFYKMKKMTDNNKALKAEKNAVS